MKSIMFISDSEQNKRTVGCFSKKDFNLFNDIKLHLRKCKFNSFGFNVFFKMVSFSILTKCGKFFEYKIL